MSQSVALKRKGLNPNKAQSSLKNMNFDIQYRSSTELANQFKIKREQLVSERTDKAKKENERIAHKRKNSEDFIPQQGKSKLVEYKSVIQSSSREELGTSHMVFLKGQTKKSLFQSGESIQEKGIKLPMHNFRFQTSSQKGVTVHVTGETLGNAEEQHDIQDLLNFKQVKRKSVLPATSLDKFLEEQQLQKEHDINGLPKCKQRATKENNEEPSKCEMFIATRTKPGKEIQADTQVAIADIVGLALYSLVVIWSLLFCLNLYHHDLTPYP
uniref:Uncharacterized protein n=1 Tax=Solanum tuberosum TaxID=4113 RepID=M1B3S5_SOLTU